jgi:hypothetical protein
MKDPPGPLFQNPSKPTPEIVHLHWKSYCDRTALERCIDGAREKNSYRDKHLTKNPEPRSATDPVGKCIQQAIVVRYDCVTIPMETSVLHAVQSNPGLSSCDEQSEDAPPALRRHAIPVFTSWITQC